MGKFFCYHRENGNTPIPFPETVHRVGLPKPGGSRSQRRCTSRHAQPLPHAGQGHPPMAPAAACNRPPVLHKVVNRDLELVPVAIREGNAPYAVKVTISGLVSAGVIVRGESKCTPTLRIRITDFLNTNGSTNKRVSPNTNGMLPCGAYWGLPCLPHSRDGMLSEQAILCPAQSVCSPPQ